MRVALVLQVLGAVAVTVGCAVLAPWLGLIIGGLLVGLFGVALERSEG